MCTLDFSKVGMLGREGRQSEREKWVRHKKERRREKGNTLSGASASPYSSSQEPWLSGLVSSFVFQKLPLKAQLVLLQMTPFNLPRKETTESDYFILKNDLPLNELLKPGCRRRFWKVA